MGYKHRTEAVKKLLLSFIEPEQLIQKDLSKSMTYVTQATRDEIKRVKADKDAFSFVVTLDESTTQLMSKNADILSSLNHGIKDYNFCKIFVTSLLSTMYSKQRSARFDLRAGCSNSHFRTQ